MVVLEVGCGGWWLARDLRGSARTSRGRKLRAEVPIEATGTEVACGGSDFMFQVVVLEFCFVSSVKKIN